MCVGVTHTIISSRACAVLYSLRVTGEAGRVNELSPSPPSSSSSSSTSPAGAVMLFFVLRLRSA
jgi:hypothetical protein